MKQKYAKQTIGFVVSLMLLSGCVSWFGMGSGYDSRSINIQTLNLFNQQIPLADSSKNWAGDWVFRRDRLIFLDEELRGAKPDMLILQAVMKRLGSPSESDTKILAAGALLGYQFDTILHREWEKTSEAEFHAVAVSIPLMIKAKKGEPKAFTKRWVLGKDGVMTLHLVESEGQIISIFNVDMPGESSTEFVWYSFIFQKIYEHLKNGRLCPKRVIVAGKLPFIVGSEKFSEFSAQLDLKDVAEEDCSLNSQCLTSTPNNAIYNRSLGREEPARIDRILVSKEAIVSYSTRSFSREFDATDYMKQYGFKKISPTRRYGWNAEVRMPRCTKDDLLLE